MTPTKGQVRDVGVAFHLENQVLLLFTQSLMNVSESTGLTAPSMLCYCEGLLSSIYSMFQQKNPEFLLTKPKRPLKMEKKVSTSCREASGFRTNIQKPAFLKVLQNPEYLKSIF